MSDLVKQTREAAPFSEDGRLLGQLADALESVAYRVALGASESALRTAAGDAKARGDIGKPEGPEAWTWLNALADRIPTHD